MASASACGHIACLALEINWKYLDIINVYSEAVKPDGPCSIVIERRCGRSNAAGVISASSEASL
jgi:hypothetical protein